MSDWIKKKSCPQKKWRIKIAQYLNIPDNIDIFDKTTVLFLENRNILTNYDTEKICEIILKRNQKIQEKK